MIRRAAPTPSCTSAITARWRAAATRHYNRAISVLNPLLGTPQFDVALSVDGGQQQFNPSNPLGVGASAQGGYLLSGAEDNNLDRPKIVQIW